MPKVSVIIPVYNTEKYLRKCLDSVCNQTLQDIEIICVNDASTDNSLKILKEYASSDNRIKIIDFSQNKGAAIARNTAIDEAKGEYIGFVDSDDYIDLDFYEKLYERAMETKADVAKGCYIYTKDNHIEYFINNKIAEDKNNFVCEYCSAIFRREAVIQNHIKFPNLTEMEDPVFAFSFACVANTVEIVPDAHINIVTRHDSQTAGIPTLEQINDKLSGLSIMLNIANNNTNINKDSYGYIFALWFNVISNSALQNKSIKTRQYFAEAIFKLSRQIKFVKNFLIESEKLSGSILNDYLQKCNIDNFILLYERKKINELLYENRVKTLTLDFMDELKDKIVKRYTQNRLIKSYGESVYFISVVNDYNIYKRCVTENPFVVFPQNIENVDFDNTKENVIIPKRYNYFLDNYNYSKSAWFIFCHSDWELLEDINPILATLDKSNLYGPIGAKANIIRDKLSIIRTGFCFEKKRNGSALRFQGNGHSVSNLEMCDTFDCQSFIVHSSLIQKYNLRFDEKLSWDLYVEDFCINAKLRYNINSYTVKIECCHWSGYKQTPQSYYDSLKYVNNKYPNQIFGGCVSAIGNKQIEELNATKQLLFRLRERVGNV